MEDWLTSELGLLGAVLGSVKWEYIFKRGGWGGSKDESKILARKQIKVKDEALTKLRTRHIHKTRRRARGLVSLTVDKYSYIKLNIGLTWYEAKKTPRSWAYEKRMCVFEVSETRSVSLHKLAVDWAAASVRQVGKDLNSKRSSSMRRYFMHIIYI